MMSAPNVDLFPCSNEEMENKLYNIHCSELDLTSALEVRTRDGLVWFFEFIVTTKRQRFLQNLANNNKFEQ